MRTVPPALWEQAALTYVALGLASFRPVGAQSLRGWAVRQQELRGPFAVLPGSARHRSNDDVAGKGVASMGGARKDRRAGIADAAVPNW